MIKRPEIKRRLNKATICKFRALAKHGSDLDLENFLYAVAMNYIAEVRDMDYIDEQDYLLTKDTTFECVCPECGATLNLDLKNIGGAND